MGGFSPMGKSVEISKPLLIVLVVVFQVRLAIAEKGLLCEEYDVSLPLSEHNEPWFMRLNPTGEVPVLVHNDNVICDPTQIIDYLEQNLNDGKTKETVWQSLILSCLFSYISSLQSFSIFGFKINVLCCNLLLILLYICCFFYSFIVTVFNFPFFVALHFIHDSFVLRVSSSHLKEEKSW